MIETERLILRQHRLDDFEDICNVYGDAEVMRFITGRASTREESWARLLRYVGHWNLLGYGFFAIVEKASGRFAGDAGLARFQRGLGQGFDDFDESGWVLAGWAHGHGYAAEALTAVHEWHRHRFGAQRTVCIVSPDHHRSLRLAEKLGYRRYGELSYHGEPVAALERLP
jgi:RimJ/RimL family protein N-acetyltransferase